MDLDRRQRARRHVADQRAAGTLLDDLHLHHDVVVLERQRRGPPLPRTPARASASATESNVRAASSASMVRQA